MKGGIKQGAAFLGYIDLNLMFDTEKGKLWHGGTFQIQALTVFPKRNEDDLGIVFGQVNMCKSLRMADPQNLIENESVVEFTYKAVFNKNLFIQPDVQYIINPGGNPLLQNALAV